VRSRRSCYEGCTNLWYKRFRVQKKLVTSAIFKKYLQCVLAAKILTVYFVVCTLAVKKKSGQVLTCRIGPFPCESYVTTDGQSASLSWNNPHLELTTRFFYCQTVAGLLMWGALSDERMGLTFTVYNVYMNVYKIYTRPLSVQTQYSRSCPIFSSFRL
jgi:hypothetical protein